MKQRLVTLVAEKCSGEETRNPHSTNGFRNSTWLVDVRVDSELGALDEAEDDGVLLADERLPDVGQRQHVVHHPAAVPLLQGVRPLGSRGRLCSLQ